MSFSQADRLRQRIEDDILTFRLKPGERLDESKLADKYGTSRTPVREALRQLSSNGLIEIRAHKGAIVTKPSIRDLIELFEVMAELEGACGRLASASGLTSDINEIAQIHEMCRTFLEANDIDGYAKAGADFHAAIYNASRNSCLIKLTIGVRNRIVSYRRLHLEQVNGLSSSYRAHSEILAAIREGRPEDADKLLQSHILSKQAGIRRLVSMFSDAEGETAAQHRNGRTPHTWHSEGFAAK